MQRLTVWERQLLRVLTDEGATILSITQRKRHVRVDYTFNAHETFTQHLPRGKPNSDPRWVKNFRADIRRHKPKDHRP